jgi:hypothetical protein
LLAKKQWPASWISPAKQGTGNHAYTVAYNGKCYDAQAVNYMLWGLAFRLCHREFDPMMADPVAIGPWMTASYVDYWSRSTAVTKVVGGKCVRLFWGLEGGKQATAFTRAGFDNSTPSDPGHTDTLLSQDNYVKGSFNYKWDSQ